MEISDKKQENNISPRKQQASKNLSDSEIFSNRLSVVSDDGNEDLRIVGFKVRLGSDIANSLALEKTKAKSVDASTILADSKKILSPFAIKDHHDSEGVLTQFLQVPNVVEQTLPQTEIMDNRIQFKEEPPSVPVLELKLASAGKDKEIEVHIRSKKDTTDVSSENEIFCSGSSDHYEAADDIAGFSNRTSRTAYCIKSPKHTPAIPLRYVTEIGTSATQTEQERESSSAQTSHVEVRELKSTEAIASQTDRTRSISTGTDEVNKESTVTETDNVHKKQMAIQTETEKVTGSSQTETAAVYSIERAYDASSQTEQHEDAGTSTNGDVYVVNRENLTEKSVDTEDLPFAPLVVARKENIEDGMKLTDNKECQCFCGHQKHNRCIYKCCFHKDFKSIMPESYIQCKNHHSATYSNPSFSECSHCHCPSKTNYRSNSTCDDMFRLDLHQLHCCKCKNLKIKCDTPKAPEVTEKLKMPEGIRVDEVSFDSFALQRNIRDLSRVEIVKSLKWELEKTKTIIATKIFKCRKIERISFLKIPVLIQYFLKIIDLSTCKTFRVVINPIDISLAVEEATIPENQKNVRSKPAPRSTRHIVMSCDDTKTTRPLLLSRTDSSKMKVSQRSSKLCNAGTDDKLKGIANDQIRSTSPKIKHKGFDYTSKDRWSPRDFTRDDVLINKVESTDIIYFGRSSSEETFERLKSMGLNDACETVNDHLLSLRPVDEDMVRIAAETLHKRWFEVAGSKNSDVREVWNYLQYFEEFSNNLLKTLLHSVDNNGNNVLHFSFANNRFDLVDELLNNGFAVDLLQKLNKAGNSPLMICSISQPRNRAEWSIVRKAFECGNVDEKSVKSGKTPLMNASSCGFHAMVDLLLNVGANPNLQDKDGSTALMYAAEHGHEKCIKSLFKHSKCDPTIQDKDGQTACSIALNNGHKDIAVLIHMQALEKRRFSKDPHFSKRYIWTNTGSKASRQKTNTEDD